MTVDNMTGKKISYSLDGRGFGGKLDKNWQMGEIAEHRLGIISIHWNVKCPDYMPEYWNLTETEFNRWTAMAKLTLEDTDDG